MKRLVLLAMAAAVAALLTPVAARAFCGFYVAKADSRLFNKASQVALVRDGDKTVLTMANDFRGEPKEFALVIPVPAVIKREQIEVVDRALLEHLDAFTAPRLVEYFDGDPCAPPMLPMAAGAARSDTAVLRMEGRARQLGVTIEARYTVGEYDILILSATQSGGLVTWLRENAYRIPAGAEAILGSYIKQGTKFFVARVNLKEQAQLGYTYLRPLRVSFESPKFMLPIRLGTVNADGPQDLFIYAVSRKGRVETTNYRSVRLPTGQDLPLYVKQEFKPFYTALFAEQVRKEDMRVVFLEYAWDMGWCDPCAADPFSADELRKLGVGWLGQAEAPAVPGRFGGGVNAYVTRLHVRYDAAHFPEDLVFQETADRDNFQGRYVLRHPWTGDGDCPQAQRYRDELRRRREQEAQTLASLTGWDVADVRRKMRGPQKVTEVLPK